VSGDRVPDSDSDSETLVIVKVFPCCKSRTQLSSFASLTTATAMASFPPDVSPASPVEVQPTIGLIGMGAMGRMYAKYLSQAGWKK
jgi:hypothetical protein